MKENGVNSRKQESPLNEIINAITVGMMMCGNNVIVMITAGRIRRPWLTVRI